jgi:LemA protein
MKYRHWWGAIVLAFLLSGCGFNTIQLQDEQAKAGWSEVLNQYQRRADLVPNLVRVVQGYAAHESKVFIAVTEARSRVGALPSLPRGPDDPASFNQFQQAQSQLSGALSRLLIVAENYPALKADVGFRDLRAQLEGTENRITVARNRYIKAVQEYNTTVRSFPSNLTAMAFGYATRPTFSIADSVGQEGPPRVDFTNPSTAGPSPGARPSR